MTADVLAKLLDIAPDGSARMVARGQAEILEPNGVRMGRVEMGHTGYRVRAGHRLRLQIASSEFPEFPPNPGDGGNRWLAEQFQNAEHTLHTDNVQPARLDITII